MELDSLDDVFLQENLGPTIAEHASQCNRLFQKSMATPGIMSDPTVMDDQVARFTLWASNMDVFGPLNVSLDYRLRYSPTVVEIIHQLLDVICDSLTSLKPIEDPPQSPSRKKRRTVDVGGMPRCERFDGDHGDGDDDEGEEEENVSLITYNIGGTVTRLYRLSSAIRKSAKNKRMDKIGKYTDDAEANDAVAELRLYTDCYIQHRFPEAPEVLRSALVEANALRLRRLFYQRSHRRRISLSTLAPQVTPQPVGLPEIADRISKVHFTSNVKLQRTSVGDILKSSGPPAAPTTYATTARQTAVKALYTNSIVELPRAKSVVVNNELSFPPMPAARSECPYCGVILELKTAAKSVVWKDHVVRDLEPFICLFAHCTESARQDPGSLTFETSKAWMGHMQTAHSHAWECRAPSHNPIVFKSEIDHQEHACKEHGVPRAHVDTLSSAARRPIVEKIFECPFGDKFEPPERLVSNTVFISDALHIHVATHMKEIALLALQKLPCDDEGTVENVDSDQPLDDTEFGHARFRGSMDSILGDEGLEFQTTDEETILNTHEENISPSIERLESKKPFEYDSLEVSTLHRAILDVDLIFVQSCIDRGVDLCSKTSNGKTTLHCASLKAHDGVEMMELLLRSGSADWIDQKDNHGQTPLHYAARVGSAEGVDLLIRYGADRDVIDDHGLSPHIWAIIAGSESVTRLFLALGIDVNTTSADGKSALVWAASLGHVSIVRLLVGYGSDITLMTRDTKTGALEEAVARADNTNVRLLLDVGADPNHRDRDGWSALHRAAEEGHLDIVHLLLDIGANVNAVSCYGTSPLHCAASGGGYGIATLLLDHGADPLKVTCHGWTALHHAAFMGHANVVEELLRNDQIRLNVSRLDNHGWSVLHLAVHSRNLATVQVLCRPWVPESIRSQCDESGYEPEEWLDFVQTSNAYRTTSALAFDKSRCCRTVTGLRQAVVSGNVHLVEALLEQGHAINGTDSGRRSALYHAIRKGHISITNMLLSWGADPEILPTGRRTWEEFVSDDTVLTILRKAGYVQPSADSELEHDIAFFLRKRAYASSFSNSGISVPDSQGQRLAAHRELMQPEMTKDSNISWFGGLKSWKRNRGK